jgi:hypothetical protein
MQSNIIQIQKTTTMTYNKEDNNLIQNFNDKQIEEGYTSNEGTNSDENSYPSENEFENNNLELIDFDLNFLLEDDNDDDM